MKTCIVSGCEKQCVARGWCATHYKRWQMHGDPLVCSRRDLANACSVNGCAGQPVARDLCDTHYTRWLRHGDPLTSLKAPDGAGYIHTQGYRRIRNDNGESRGEHIIIVECILGRCLKDDQQVHHVDQDKANNKNANLVVCPDTGYHQLLHKRQRALDACGNANFVKCCHCQQHDDPTNLIRQARYSYHSECRKQYQIDLRAKKRGLTVMSC